MPANTDFLSRIRAHHKGISADGSAIGVKPTTIKGAVIDRDKRLVKGLITTTARDMDGEVVLSSGFDFSYFPNSVRSVYLNHDYDSMPVGTNEKLAVRDNGRALFASTFITRRAIGDDILTAMEEGSLGGFSVGFKAMDFGPPSHDEVDAYGPCDSIVRRALLIEYSLTAMPANQQALAELVSKSLIHRSSAVAFGLQDAPERKMWPTGAARRVFCG